MRISQQLGILTLSAIIVIVMVAVSAYYCLSLLTESHDAVQKSAEALEGTQEVCFHMAYASASQRAYIITGFDSSLDQYRAEVSNTRQTLENLSQSVKDKPAERELVGELGRGLNDRLASLENTLQIYETKGQQAAFARIKQGVGLAMMTHTVELANKLRDYELHQLLDGRKTAEINAKNTQLTIILGSILASAIVSISSLFFSRNLSNAVSSLLRASQNLAQERFESLVDIRNNNELGDLGRAFNVLAGHLKEKAKEADQAEQRRDKAEEELKNATAEIAQLRIQSAELAGLVQESKLEQELAAEHQKHLVDQVKDVASLSAMLSNLLQQVLDFSRDSRIAAETLDRRCLEMSEEMSKFGDQA
ncbi:MAG TPA: CHASE3 domain-containing protein, partial [Chroococcales cyanobacterium]